MLVYTFKFVVLSLFIKTSTTSAVETSSEKPSFTVGDYAIAPLTREERASKARVIITQHFNNKLQVFLDFVLAHYVSIGVEELDQAKLTPLLRLKYHDSLSDAVADLGKPDVINKAFRDLKSIFISIISEPGES